MLEIPESDEADAVSFYAGLTPEQKKLVLEYDGDETHGEPEFLMTTE